MKDFDPTDPFHEEQRTADEAERLALAAKQAADDFLWLMNDPRGRRIVWSLLGEAGVFRASFDTDAGVMAFNEGRRHQGLRLLEQVHNLCPDLYTTMMKEQSK